MIPHLRKCCENLIKIKFDAQDLPSHMVSAEQEEVVLKNYHPKGDEVEIWFKELEEAMKSSLKSVFRNALFKMDDETITR